MREVVEMPGVRMAANTNLERENMRIRFRFRQIPAGVAAFEHVGSGQIPEACPSEIVLHGHLREDQARCRRLKTL